MDSPLEGADSNPRSLSRTTRSRSSKRGSLRGRNRAVSIRRPLTAGAALRLPRGDQIETRPPSTRVNGFAPGPVGAIHRILPVLQRRCWQRTIIPPRTVRLSPEGTRSLSALAGGAVRASIRISCKSVAFHVFSLVANPAWRMLVWTSCGFRVDRSPFFGVCATNDGRSTI
jgi:hypothetical protein